MTNTYNTLNPLGSVSAKDLSDNASNFDEGMNSLSPSFYDRFKKRRETWAGMEKQVNDFLEAMGFEATHLQYVDGTPLTVLRPTQLVERAPSVYKVKAPATFPVNLTGTWATDQLLLVDVGDAALRQELSTTQGGAIIKGVSQVVGSISGLRALLKTSYSLYAFATGYYAQGDGGGGEYWLDIADTTTADNGGTVIVATDGGRWKLSQQSPVSIRQFGAIAGVFDAPTQTINNNAFQAARDWVASGAEQNQLVFPAGVYGYNVSPNWAIQDAEISSSGEVRLRYFGTGNAVIIDHGPTINTFLYNVTMGTFIIEAPSTAQHGVYIRSIHHGKLRFKVEGAGTNYAGIKVDFAVCTDFSNSSCSPNENNGWYLSAMPKYGLWLAKRNTGEQVSYSYFGNTIWEGLAASGGAGILLEGTLGNVFYGGTSEGCDHGIITTTEAINNKFWGIDLEANATHDILEQGQGQEYHGVDSATLVTVGATALFPKFFGGNYETVEIATGARWPLFQGLNVNRFATGIGGFTNGEPTSMFRDCIDLQFQVIVPLSQGSITVGASPYSYTNLTGNKQVVSITGGTISAVSITRNAINNGLDAGTKQVLLSPGDSVVVTYSVLPSMYQYSH